jgi:hypothetical protein
LAFRTLSICSTQTTVEKNLKYIRENLIQRDFPVALVDAQILKCSTNFSAGVDNFTSSINLVDTASAATATLESAPLGLPETVTTDLVPLLDNTLVDTNSTLVTPFLIVDHNQLSQTVKHIVHKHFNVVDPEKKIFNSPIISYRRAPNLNNSLVNIRRNNDTTFNPCSGSVSVRTTLPSSSSSSSSSVTVSSSVSSLSASTSCSLPSVGQLPCAGKRCLLCAQLQPTVSLSFPQFNFSWNLRGPFDCNSTNCVYLAVCSLCDLKYVGETVNFRDRMNGHSSQQYSLPRSSFYKHREDTGHNFRNFKLYILRSNLTNKDDLRNWEAFFY